MFGIAACYKLDKKYDQIMKELIARENKDDLDLDDKNVTTPRAKSDNQVNISIGRLYGASGRKIAGGLAKKLNCNVYDKEIIYMLGEKFGMESVSIENLQKFLDSYNENISVTFAPYSYSSAGVAKDVTDIEMFEEQSRIIRNIAKHAPGIFLGRCANFVLAEQEHSYSFFIYADDVYREKEGKEYYKGQSLEELKTRDEHRNEYYQRFTGMKRDDPQNYDMVVNVSKTGVDGAVQMILDYVQKKENRGR